jgi:predicted nucleic acid-binding protein
MRFVDTNILLYSISTLLKEAPKAAIAREILRSRDLVLSVQVLQEFYVQATRPSRPDPLSHDEAIAFIETWKRFPIVDVTLGLFDEAVKVKSRYQLSYWDAAIIAAARQAGCTEVLSEDMNAGQDYGGVRVVNPFAP